MTGELDPAFETLLEFLKTNRGFDFTGYKRASLIRRVTRRMQQVGVDSFDAYRDYLELHQDEFVPLFNTILINVTRFFRDPDSWTYLREHVLPELVTHRSGSEPIRVWSAGCSSGEEPYTLAIVLAELLGEEQFREQVKIYATDVDEEALELARHAVHPEKALEGVPADLQAKYFESADGGMAFRKDLRRCVIFGRHDLVQDAPISRIDLLTCRNVLMYFNAETQTRILNRFHFALAPHGVLMLGKVEMLLTHSDLFDAVDVRRRIFRRSGAVSLRQRLLVLAEHGVPAGNGPGWSTNRMAEAALDAVPVASIVVDIQGFLITINARARDLFGLAPKDLGRPFQDLEMSYRPMELRSVIERVRDQRRAERVGDVEWVLKDGRTAWFAVDATPVLADDGGVAGIQLTFNDVTRRHQLHGELIQANRELEMAYEELQSTNEELETTNEELQSTVEELETTNEELQSTNEELETMNEELQSTNEELHTMNDELRGRESELFEINAFLESMLRSLHVAVVVLDEELSVQVWNGVSEELFGLRASEVKAQDFFNLQFGLPVEQLAQPIRAALGGQSEAEVVVPAVNRVGRKFTARVRITPLRGVDAVVRGAIVLIEDHGAEPAAD